MLIPAGDSCQGWISHMVGDGKTGSGVVVMRVGLRLQDGGGVSAVGEHKSRLILKWC